MKNITLDNLPLNKKGLIKEINCNGNIKRRLLDLGLISNTPIVPVFKSVSGDPTAFEIRNTIIAIRKEEASLINVLFWFFYHFMLKLY